MAGHPGPETSRGTASNRNVGFVRVCRVPARWVGAGATRPMMRLFQACREVSQAASWLMPPTASSTQMPSTAHRIASPSNIRETFGGACLKGLVAKSGAESRAPITTKSEAFPMPAVARQACGDRGGTWRNGTRRTRPVPTAGRVARFFRHDSARRQVSGRIGQPCEGSCGCMKRARSGDVRSGRLARPPVACLAPARGRRAVGLEAMTVLICRRSMRRHPRSDCVVPITGAGCNTPLPSRRRGHGRRQGSPFVMAPR